MAEKARRGRPEFVPTEEQRDDVIRRVASGHTHVDIAMLMGITTPTLRKHFAKELRNGAVILADEMERLELTLAREGKIRAVRNVHDRARRVADPEGAGTATAAPAGAQKKRYVGKKEMRVEAAAAAATGIYAPAPLPPAQKFN
jgi:hypothetical protein